jgi:Carboxypeptidase regulatory-like domain/TonB dependent receptor
MKTKSVVFWLKMLLLMFSSAGLCMAQSDTARLQGTVSDAQGAAMNGAAVTVTSTDTGRVSTTTTNELGYYSVSALPPGNYKVDVSQKGFKTVSRQLALQVAQVGVADFQLSIGAQTEIIEVIEGSPVINPQDSALGNVVEGRQVTDLPLNGRNFTQLATLVPGVTRGAPGVATASNNNAETFRFGQSGGASLAVNGLRPQADNFILDGIDNNDALVGTIIFFPPADAIDEFRVQTSVAPAQYGRAGGALVVTTLKAGSNDIHGSAFWFNRNKALNAQDFFDSPGTPTPGFTRNQFGGTLGMPIIKNKLFVFMDYEGLRQSIPGGPEYATVPTELMRQGDFSELLTDTGTGYNQTFTVIDPSTGLQFMGSGSQPNVIPANRINSAGLAYINAFPQPDCTHAEDPNCFSVFHDYKNVRKLIENWNDFDVRVDYILDSSNTLFGRFSRGRADQTDTTRLTTLPSGYGSGTNFNHPWGASIGLTTTISQTMINEFRGGFFYTQYGYLPPQNNVDLCTQLGIVNCNTPLLGGIALIGGYNNQIEYTGDYGTYLIPQTAYNYNDTLTWTKGRHTFKFGGGIIRRDLNLYRPLAGKGYFVISGNGNQGGGGFAPAMTSTGYEVSDLLAGFMAGYQHGTQYGMVGTRNWENGFYAQDDYRVNNRLTLNLGLRYDVLTWPVEVQDRQANYDLATGALVIAGSNGSSRQLLPNDYHNFGPRLGFAYQLTNDGKTVLRGGYGLFYFIDRGGISNQMAQNPPFGGTNSVTYAEGYYITLSGSLPCQPTCTQSQLISTNATGPLPTGNFTNLNLAAPTNVSVISYLSTNLTPMVSQWNLQLQRQIATNQSVSLAYVGTNGDHLTRNYNANQQLYGTGDQLDPNLGGSITVQDNRGKSSYNALQAQYERRFTGGLQFMGSFTWSKTLDDSCGDLDVCSPQLYTDYNIERGLSTIDQDYRMVLSSLYELPFGRGKRWGRDVSKWVDYVVGGWQLNGIYTLQSGMPFSVTVDGTPGNTRADVVGSPSVNPGNIHNYINAAAFAVPTKNAAGFFIAPGTAARDLLRGPGSSNMDLALFKNVAFTERLKAQFRVQAYNLTNTPHFSNPDGDLSQGAGVFGAITGVQTNSWRQVELGLRLTF